MAIFKPITQPIDVVTLGGFTTPGLAVLDGVALDYEWEIRKGNSVSGATKVLKGRGLTKCSVKVTLYDEAEIAAWEDFISKIRYLDQASNQALKGYDITHPLANLYGLRSVTVTRVLPMVQGGSGEWETGLELEEYREPVIVSRKASGTRASPHPVDVEPEAEDPEVKAARLALERQQAINKAAGLPI